MPKIKFAAIQISNCDTKSIEERDANLLHAQKIIDELEAVDLIVLPELFTSGYSRKTFEQLGELAEDVNGKSFQFFSDIAQKRNCYICYGFPGKEKMVSLSHKPLSILKVNWKPFTASNTWLNSETLWKRSIS